MTPASAFWSLIVAAAVCLAANGAWLWPYIEAVPGNGVSRVSKCSLSFC